MSKLNKWVASLLLTVGSLAIIGIGTYAYLGQETITDMMGYRSYTILAEDRRNTLAGMRLKGDPGTGALLTQEAFATGTTSLNFASSTAVSAAAAYLIGACVTSEYSAAATMVLSNQATAGGGATPNFYVAAPSGASQTVCIMVPHPVYYSTGIFATCTQNQQAQVIYRTSAW